MTADTTVLDLALADMRAGRRVALVVSNGQALDRIAWQAHQLSRPGETVTQRMISSGTGMIRFFLYANASGAMRGLEVDRVYFDHSDVHTNLAPTMCTSTAPGPRFVHGPAEHSPR